jgi:hypothetical protein
MFNNISIKKRTTLISSILLISLIIGSFMGMIGDSEAAPVITLENVKSFQDLDFSDLEEMGYRPRFAYPGAQKLQTPEPAPEGAVYPPQTPTSSSPPTRANWETYYSDTVLTVKFDNTSTSRYPNSALTSQEKQLLDRFISDFLNFSYPIVKDYYDPNDRVDDVMFKVWDIDGPSGTGGYFQPGTNEFNVDRSDLSWGGVIIAHEFQHYIHDQYDRYEYLWINEGCADYSAYLVYDLTSATAGHVYAYLEYRPYYGLIVDDYSWQRDGTTAYYGNAFLYQMYMTHQYGGKNWSRAIIKEGNRGTTGVSRALSSLGYSDRFTESFENWMAATRLNSASIGEGEYEYPEKSYSYGQIKIGLSKTHSGVPITTNRDLRGYSINSIRFTSPPSNIETFRLKLSFSAGTPMVGFYPETSSNKDITWLDFGSSRSYTYDFTGWGNNYNAFQLIFSTTGQANLEYDLDVLDLDAPVTTMAPLPRLPDGTGGWYVSPPKITLQSEAGANIKYQIDNGVTNDYIEPFWLPDGIHTLSYWAFDRHNNIEEKNTAQFKVDTQVPTSDIEIDPDLPEDNWYTDPPLISLTSSHPDTFIYYKWGNDDFEIYGGPFIALEGENVLHWKAIDQAGNEEDARSRSFKVDTIDPTMKYIIYPPAPDGFDDWYITTPQITLTSVDAAAIYYAIGNSILQPYLGPFEMPDGENTLRITCTDQAGNVAEEVRLRFKVDTIEPSVTGTFQGYEYTPENSSSWLNIPPILSLEGSESGMSINYTINNGEPMDYEFPFEISEGENEIWVRGVDEAGNTAESLYYLVKVDKRVPFIEHEFSHEMKNGWFLNSRASIDLVPADEDDRSSQIKIYYRWGGENAKIFRGPVDILEGLNSFSYWAEDLAGNEMELRSIQVKKDSTQPLIFLDTNGLGDGKIEVGEKLHVDLTGSTDDSGIQSYSIDYYGSGILDWTPNGVFEHVFAVSGTYEVTVYVKDAAGNIVNQSFTVKVKDAQENPKPVENNDGMDTGLLLVVIGIGAAVVILIMVLGVVLLFVKNKRAEQVVPIQKLQQVSPGRPHPGLNHPPHHPAAPPKPPIRPLPP